jgi:hypothetical protein
MNDPISLIGGATITVQVIAGRNFVAKDRTLFGRKKRHLIHLLLYVHHTRNMVIHVQYQKIVCPQCGTRR